MKKSWGVETGNEAELAHIPGRQDRVPCHLQMVNSVSLSCSRLASHITIVLDQLTEQLQRECTQRGTSSVIGQFTGAPLVSMETSEVISTQELESAVANESEEMVVRDPGTGLLIPGPSARIRLPDGSTRSIPPNHIIHPKTGRVVPLEGNVAYDHLLKKAVLTCDSPEVATRDSNCLFPFIPFPLSVETGQPVETNLPTLETITDLHAGSTMKDPATGLNTPVLAVTIHPRTRTAHLVGGSYRDPVTGLPIPIEIGGMLIDKHTDMPAPILGIHIDPYSTSGRVVPTGGSIAMRDQATKSRKTVLAGERFTEPLSQLPVRASSAYIGVEEGELVRGYGGRQSVLDTDELSAEKEAIDSLVKLKDLTVALLQAGSQDEGTITDQAEALQFSLQQLLRLRAKNQSLYLRRVHALHLRKLASEKLATGGGSPGYMEFKPTGQPLPLLLGTTIPDPAGSEIQVSDIIAMTSLLISYWT